MNKVRIQNSCAVKRQKTNVLLAKIFAQKKSAYLNFQPTFDISCWVFADLFFGKLLYGMAFQKCFSFLDQYHLLVFSLLS